MGTTLGYHAPADYLFIDYAVHMWALTVGLPYGPVRIRAGPAAFDTITTRTDQPSAGAVAANSSKLGWVVGGALSLRVLGPLRVEGRVEYRKVGNAMVGPYEVEAFNQPSRTFPAASVTFDHWFWGIGAGVRF